MHATLGCPGHSVYAGTKGAINALTRELAVELLPCAYPRQRAGARHHRGAELLAEIAGIQRGRRDNAVVPWGRVGLPEDVGYLAAYLISDGSEFMTGSVLYFDGGLTAKMALPEQSAQSEG